MNTGELRIGNWVHSDIHNSDIAFKSFYGLCNLEKSIDYYKPIPLTEEWLLRFGFKKEELVEDGVKWFEMHIINRLRFLTSDFPLKKQFNEEEELWLEDVDCNIFVRDIKYVHQLQNLFFALTGKELELKDEPNRT